jgi:Flp pilus assembly protein TadG
VTGAWLRRRADDERGMVTAFVTIFVVALIFVIGLVLDGGYLLAAKREVNNIAAEAARAGAQQLDVAAFRADSSVDKLDHDRAQAAAEAFLARAGATGHATPYDDHIEVTATVKHKMLILALFGGEKEVSGTASARGVQGE